MQQAREDITRLLAQHFPGQFREPAKAQDRDGPCARARARELEELVIQFGADVDVLGELEWRILLRRDNALRVLLTPRYPLEEPPTPVVECASGLRPWFSEEDLLDLWTPGYGCIHLWMEHVKDALVPVPEAMLPTRSLRSGSDIRIGTSTESHLGCFREVDIVWGQPLVIRGWSFQPYLASATSAPQAQRVWRQLLDDKRIAAADYHAAAYRVQSNRGSVFACSCVEAGEAESGEHLAGILSESAAEILFIMVSRTVDRAAASRLGARLNSAALLRQDAKVARRILADWRASQSGGQRGQARTPT